MRRFMMDGHALKSCDFIPRVEKGGGHLSKASAAGKAESLVKSCGHRGERARARLGGDGRRFGVPPSCHF